MINASVIIPTHNRPDLLKRAINSVINQTYKDWELLIINDGDRPLENLIKEINDGRIKIFNTHRPSSGGSTARNIGINNAEGSIVAFLDDDDEWTEDHLSEHVKVHEEIKEVAMVYNRVKVLGRNNELLNDKKLRLVGLHQPTEALLKRCFVFTVAMSMKTSIAKEFLFDEKLPKNQEWDLSIRVSQKYKLFGIDKTLTLVHMGESTQMGSVSNIKNIIKGHEMLIEKHSNLYKKFPKSLAARYFELAGLYKIDNNFVKWKSLLRSAYLLDKSNTTYLYNWLLSLFGEAVYNTLH